MDVPAGEAPTDLRADVPPTPVDVPITHEAAVLEQRIPDISQPGEGADVAKGDPVDVPVQVGCTPMSTAGSLCPPGQLLNFCMVARSAASTPERPAPVYL